MSYAQRPGALIPVLAFFWLALSCSQKPPANQYEPQPGNPLVDRHYSLSADREKLEELRKDIPEETKIRNDEEAFIQQLVNEVKRPPADVRRAFDSAVRKKRHEMDRDLQRLRKDFSAQEKKERDAFLKEQTRARQEFLRGKPTKEARTEFFREQDEKRRTFFSDAREKRNDFESQVRERRKEFEDRVRARTNEFNQEMRAYTRKYNDMKREKEKAQREELNRQNSAGPSHESP